MKAAIARTDRVLIITFLVGVIGIIYFLMGLFMFGSGAGAAGIPEAYLSWMMTERFMVTGMIFVILIILAYVLMAQKSLEQSRAAEHERAPKPRANEKEIKEDMQRYYRDLGALKIVLKDGVMDPKTYNERKKYLEQMIKAKKKQLESVQAVKGRK